MCLQQQDRGHCTLNMAMSIGIHTSTTLDTKCPRASTQVTVKSNLRIGIGGPVGSGKTALVAMLCRSLAGDLELVVNIMQEENRHEEVNLDINLTIGILTLWTWVMGGLNAQEKIQGNDTARWKPVPGPKELIEGIVGPPAVVKDWERDYPQYQPLGKGDTEQAPDAKPGTPNPPDIHKLGGADA
jgi:hypothetical protein